MERTVGRILGLDLGRKGIGVAVSDELGYTAQPVLKIERKSYAEDVQCVSELVRQYAAVKIVVGLPLKMDGTYGTQARLVSSFVERLRAVIKVPVVMWDERFSTTAVTRVLLEADVSRKKRKKCVDKMAAAFILQGYLNHEADRG